MDRHRCDHDVERFLLLLAARRAPRTVQAYRRDLAGLSAWRGAELANVSAEELERWVAPLRAEGLAAATIARRPAAVRAFCKHLQLLGVREDNPAASLNPP